MKRRGPGILAELVPLALILGCIASTSILVINAHRQVGGVARDVDESTPVALTALPAPAPPEPPREPEKPRVVVIERPRPPAPVDDTERSLARFHSAEAADRAAAIAADRKADALERAIASSESETQRLRRREALVKSQVAELTERARRIETETDALASERDVLVRERDLAKADLARAMASGGGYAVRPHRGPNGTWQRPVVIECRNGQAILQPRGQVFSMLDMSPLLGARSSPLVSAVGREMIRVQEVTAPDGAPVDPYIYFIVRPDGIRPFYEARARLEPLGIAFGYELVDQDWRIDFPDPETWDTEGVVRPERVGSSPGEYAWPSDRATTGGKDPADNAFLWPRHGGGQGSIAETETDAPGRGGPAGVGALARRGGDVLSGREPNGDLEPFPRGLGGRSGDGVGSGGAGRPLPSRGDGGGRGLGALDPGRLPAFEPTGLGQPPRGVSNLGAGASPGAARPGNRLGAPEPGPGVPLVLGGARGTESGATPAPGSGRVRIDPRWLASLDDEDGDDDHARPSPPTGLRLMPDEGGSAGRPGERTGQARGSGAPSGLPGQVPGVGSPGGTPSGGPGALGGSPGVAPRGGGMASAPGAANGSRSGTIEAPLDLVVVCEPKGVVLHPGGYRLSLTASRDDRGLVSDLETIVRNHQLIDAGVVPRPRLKFLLQPGGEETYLEARKQTVLAGLSWPVTVQIAGNFAPRVFQKERF